MRLIAFLLLLLPATAGAAPRVLADLPVIHSLAAAVMEGQGTPEVLLGRGEDPHHVQLRPSQRRALADANLVIWTGPGLTPWLGRLLPEGAGLELLDVPGTHLREGEDGHGHGHGEEAHEGHEGPVDPHAWLDPRNAALWGHAIAEALAARDPEAAEAYRANARALEARLLALEARIAAELAPVAGAPLLLSHDAAGYFTARFGLSIAGSVTGAGADRPGAAHLSELRADAAAAGARCLLVTEAAPDAQSRQLAASLDLRLETVAVTGAGRSVGPGLYEAVLEDLGRALARCLAPGG